jgi:predicted nucleic acid-binding Zn ribbon protein
MKPRTETGDPRRCIECEKPIVRRRTTALYCSGKCREIYNARKRRQARQEMKEAVQPAHAPETCVPETEA